MSDTVRTQEGAQIASNRGDTSSEDYRAVMTQQINDDHGNMVPPPPAGTTITPSRIIEGVSSQAGLASFTTWEEEDEE